MTGKTHLWVGNPEFFFLEIPKKTVMVGRPYRSGKSYGRVGDRFLSLCGPGSRGEGDFIARSCIDTEIYIYNISR